MSLFQRKKQQAKTGFTLIEILLVVGFIAVAGTIVFLTYNKASSSYMVEKQIKDDILLRDNIRNYFSGTPKYSRYQTLTTTFAIQADLAPPDMVIPGNTVDLRNVWGSKVGIMPWGDALGPNGSPDGSFVIVHYNISKDVCTKYVTAMEAGFLALNVAGIMVKNINSPFDRATAASACDTAVNGNTIQVMGWSH